MCGATIDCGLLFGILLYTSTSSVHVAVIGRCHTASNSGSRPLLLLLYYLLSRIVIVPIILCTPRYVVGAFMLVTLHVC